jgi:hypothetical protein
MPTIIVLPDDFEDLSIGDLSVAPDDQDIVTLNLRRGKRTPRKPRRRPPIIIAPLDTGSPREDFLQQDDIADLEWLIEKLKNRYPGAGRAGINVFECLPHKPLKLADLDELRASDDPDPLVIVRSRDG